LGSLTQHLFIMKVLLFNVIHLLYIVKTTNALSCTSILQTLDCLPAFTHTPSHLPKCYCTSLCPDVETLRQTCQSGQLQIDQCGVCLECAPGFGERCGGYANKAGVCAGSLGCLIKYQPGIERETNKTGTCVTEQGKECKDVKNGVSCRPGQIGIPSDFVFCPTTLSPPSASGCDQESGNSNRVASVSGNGFLFTNSGTTSRPLGTVTDPDREQSQRSSGSLGDTIRTIASAAGQLPLPSSVQQIIGRR